MYGVNNMLVFKERPDYRFILDDSGNVLDIVAENVVLPTVSWKKR